MAKFTRTGLIRALAQEADEARSDVLAHPLPSYAASFARSLVCSIERQICDVARQCRVQLGPVAPPPFTGSPRTPYWKQPTA